MPMKLGEALSERARMQRRISELRNRISGNTHVREGEEVAEDASFLLDRVTATTQTLEDLIVRINLANAATLVEGKTITEWLARRDALASIAATYNSAADAAQQRDRSSMFGRASELRVELTVDVPMLREKAEEALDELRRVDNKIQEANWQTVV